jgi:hypothetical protein
MEIDVKSLKPPSEEEVRWLESMTEGEDNFPGDSGIGAYRMRVRLEAAARQRKFDEIRIKLRKVSRPWAKAA